MSAVERLLSIVASSWDVLFGVSLIIGVCILIIVLLTWTDRA